MICAFLLFFFLFPVLSIVGDEEKVALAFVDGVFGEDGKGKFHAVLSIPAGQQAYHASLKLTSLSTDIAKISEVHWPKPLQKKDPAFGEVVEIYEGDIPFQCHVDLLILPEEDSIEVPIEVHYQTCTETMCFPPESIRMNVLLQKSAGVVFSASSIQSLLHERGVLLSLVLVYFLGVGASFTPCVFPLIPVVLTLIGAGRNVSGMKGLFLSFLFVLGLASTYTCLGILAAKTGGFFGELLLLKPVQLGFAVVFFLLALSMFGAFELQVPSCIRNRMSAHKGSGATGAFLTGMAFGVAGSACLSPILAGILGLIAQMGQVLLGAGLLFSFGLGLGTLFLVIGFSFGSLAALQKPGIWLDEIKRVFGLLLLSASLFYLRGPSGPSLFPFLVAISLVTSGVFVGNWGIRPDHYPFWYIKTRQSLGLIAIILGGSMLFHHISQNSMHSSYPPSSTIRTPTSSIAWERDLDLAIARAMAETRPILLFVSSPNCLACVELEHKSLHDVNVLLELKRFIPVYIMLDGSRDAKEFIQKYDIRGTPTLRFLGSTGYLLEHPRVDGFVEAKSLLSLMKGVQ